MGFLCNCSMEKITYKQGMSSKKFTGYFWVIGFPVIILALAMIIVMQFGKFGQNLIARMVGAMRVVGAAYSFILPSHRKSIVTETHWTIVGYLLGLFGLREVIKLVSGTTTQMLMATYQQAMPAASGASLSGFPEYTVDSERNGADRFFGHGRKEDSLIPTQSFPAKIL